MSAAEAQPPLRAIVLDRARSYRALLEAVLGESACTEVVASTRDAEDAVREARAMRPDLVIVEPAGLEAPIELLRRLREAAPGVRIVLLSALPDPLLTGFDGHADLVLAKGIDGGRLVRALTTLEG